MHAIGFDSTLIVHLSPRPVRRSLGLGQSFDWIDFMYHVSLSGSGGWGGGGGGGGGGGVKSRVSNT